MSGIQSLDEVFVDWDLISSRHTTYTTRRERSGFLVVTQSDGSKTTSESGLSGFLAHPSYPSQEVEYVDYLGQGNHCQTDHVGCIYDLEM